MLHRVSLAFVSNQRKPTLGLDNLRKSGHDRSDEELLGRNLKAAREASGTSQAALGEYMVSNGFSAWRQTTVSRTERGERELLWGEAVALEGLFGTEVWKGTNLAGTTRHVVDAVIARSIEGRMDRIGKELDELRALWIKYKEMS